MVLKNPDRQVKLAWNPVLLAKAQTTQSIFKFISATVLAIRKRRIGLAAS